MWRYRAVDSKGDPNAGLLPNGWNNFGTGTDIDFMVNTSIVFSSGNKGAGDGVGPPCSVGTRGGSWLALLFAAVALISSRRARAA
jgi:hypothetical protein